MVIKLSNKEKSGILNTMAFYDFDNFSIKTGEETVIEFKKNLGDIRYCDLQYYNYNEKLSKEYLKKEKMIIKILISFIKYFDEEIIVFNAGTEWMKDKRIAPGFNKMIINSGITNNDNMFKISDLEEIAAISKSIFRYNTFASFLFSKKEIIITPTDHLDLFIFSQVGIQKIISDVVKNCTEFKRDFIVKS